MIRALSSLALCLFPFALSAAQAPPHPSDTLGPQLVEDQALVLPRDRDTSGRDPAFVTSFMGAVDAYRQGDYEVARSLWEQLAEIGFAPAQHNLGVMHEHGRGGRVDFVRAAKWYARAGEKEIPAALLNLARLHLQGRGVAKDAAQALHLLESAARLDYPPAQYNLGIAYLKGRGVEVDPEEAAEWFGAAAESGYAPAQYNLAGLYLRGEGVDADRAEALSLFGEAARAGDPLAHLSLGILYYRDKDMPRAAMHLKTAAEAGLAAAQNQLAIMLARGEVMGKSGKRDPETALMWFHVAASMGGVEAAKNRDAFAKSVSPKIRKRAQVRAVEFRPHQSSARVAKK